MEEKEDKTSWGKERVIYYEQVPGKQRGEPLWAYYSKKRLGKGRFGKVYQGANLKDGRKVAVKVIKLKEHTDMDSVSREVELMRKLEHKNIAQFHAVFLSSSMETCHIVLELCELGNLWDYCQERRPELLSEEQVQVFMGDIIGGWLAMHDKKIYHRDIKSANFVLAAEEKGGDGFPIVKFCDFGCGKALSASNEMAQTYRGTPLYMAPEMLRTSEKHEYNPALVDIWSMGRPHEEKEVPNPLALLKAIERWKGTLPIHPEYRGLHNERALDLLKRMLEPNPAKRISPDELRKHEYVTSSPRFKAEPKKGNMEATIVGIGEDAVFDDDESEEDEEWEDLVKEVKLEVNLELSLEREERVCWDEDPFLPQKSAPAVHWKIPRGSVSLTCNRVGVVEHALRSTDVAVDMLGLSILGMRLARPCLEEIQWNDEEREEIRSIGRKVAALASLAESLKEECLEIQEPLLLVGVRAAWNIARDWGCKGWEAESRGRMEAKLFYYHAAVLFELLHAGAEERKELHGLLQSAVLGWKRCK